MGQITAVILAAGLGVRMGARGKLMPKGLIPVGGIPMMVQSIDMLRAHGIERIRIVTGHLAEQYQAVFAGQPDIELVHNDHYATTGSLLSLSCGLDGLLGPVLLLESDLVYSPEALLALDGTRDRLLLSGITGSGDEQYVWAAPAEGRQRFVHVSKDMHAQPEPYFGELVGIMAFTGATVARMRDVAQRELARDPEEHYEPALVVLAHETPLEAHMIADLPWAEVDDEEMLIRAEREVYPKVLAARTGAALPA